ISQQSVVAQTASHCFDISVWQMFAAPLVGGKTVVYPDDVVLEPDRLIDRAEADGITVIELVPSHLSAVLDSAEDRRRVFSGLRWIEVTGEPVSKALMRRWFEMFPHIPVANAYGPTECSDNVTHLAMYGVPEGSTVPVGRPLRNINIYVTDSHMNLCPVGVKGEICASGVGVGRGYLNDQVLTAGSFVEDPFIDRKGVRLYKTGDLGCYLPDGNLVLFGRKDQQVKLRGFRIELGGIEAALAMLDGVREAAVVDRRDDGKEPYLCAYFTSRNGKRPNAGALALDLAQVLPDYMLPAAFVEMEALPVTVNGKVDRKALPAPSLVQMPSVAEYVAPRSDVHRTLAEVWSATLSVPSPGIHDNFFSLGGDSILSMQVVSRARRAGLKVAMTDVFRYPTIAELALRTSKIEPGSGNGTVHTAKPSGQAPLTPIQLYFLEKTKIEPHHYNQSVLVEMADGVDPGNLDAALHLVVEIHDSLRLRFPIVDGVPQQHLSPSAAGFLFVVRDLAEVPEPDRKAAIRPVAEDLQRSLN
ncbi:MAG: AMP-binding protein, partial [Blastocatellia bacterium]